MVYVCADDYGLTTDSSNRIRECVEKGALNKISIFPNSDIDEIIEDVSVGIHINLVEGKCVSAPDEISLLADKDGHFKHSFTGLLKLSLSSRKKEFEKQVYLEIKNQIRQWQRMVGRDEDLEIDTHQHVHMIPLIFKALMDVINDEKLKVKYMRIPVEPIMPYLMTPSLYFSYKPINLVKFMILKTFKIFNNKRFKRSGIKTALFMGVLFSGRMIEKNVLAVYPYYEKIAKKKNMDIELLFHPGYIEEGENLFDINKKDFNKFYISEERKSEYDTLISPNVKKTVMKEGNKNAIY